MDKKLNSTSPAPKPSVMSDTLSDYTEFDMNKAKESDGSKD